MRSFHYKPAAPLDRFVHVIWCLEQAPTAHPRERLLPDGSAEMVINLHDVRFRFIRGKLWTGAKCFATRLGCRRNCFAGCDDFRRCCACFRLDGGVGLGGYCAYLWIFRSASLPS